MSDFAGIWRLDGSPMDTADIRRLASGLEGRGIERPRIWRSGSIAVVHRQHIFTPEDRHEHQPCVGKSGATLVADLCLGDRRTLINALALPPSSISAPDSTLLLTALETWGVEKTLARLCGTFAFALWNPSTRQLSLARDPSGSSPLFIHCGARIVAFATRLRPLLSLPDIPRDLDDMILADRLTLNVREPFRTLYQKIDRVPAGTLTVVTPDSVRTQTWWQLPQPGTLRFDTPEKTVEAATAILDTVVADALRAEDPVSLCLTGGLDSGAIASSAAQQVAPGRVLVLTRIPSGAVPAEKGRLYYDESSRAKKVADRYPNMDWQMVGDDGEDWGERDARRWFIEGGLPRRAPTNREWFFPLFRRMTEHGSRVMLGGEYGNAFFSYSGVELLAELFLGLKWRQLTQLAFSLKRGEDFGPLQLGRQLYRAIEPIPFRLWRQRQRHPWSKFSAIHADFAAELHLDRVLDPHLYRMRVGAGPQSANDMRQWICGDEEAHDLSSTGRALSGIDARKPLADRRIMEFFGALPLEVFLHGGRWRSVARRVLADRLPDTTLASSSGGRQNSDWHGTLTSRLETLRNDVERLRASPLAQRVLDIDRMCHLLDTWPSDVETAQEQQASYHRLLSRGLEVGQFLAWHEGGNGAIPQSKHTGQPGTIRGGTKANRA
ncbi:MAG: asparagine synthetase B [Rhodospirillaceae bacterium]|nr:asparagine synthetase B [Rhodospirillaceae bacterium]